MVIDIAVSDVRCVPGGARCSAANGSGPGDYSGEMRFSFAFRLTDHWNAPAPGGGTDAATVQDFATAFSWACAQTESTSTGATCNFNTSMNAVIPGAAYGDRREVWELGAAGIFD